MKTSSHCGPGRKLISAGRYGWNPRVHFPLPLKALNTAEPKNWKP